MLFKSNNNLVMERAAVEGLTARGVTGAGGVQKGPVSVRTLRPKSSLNTLSLSDYGRTELYSNEGAA